jgi:hypothetical protein
MRSVRLQSVLERFFSQRGYDRRRRLEEVFHVWDEVIGEPYASFARPLSIEDGVLTLSVANSTVASEVSFSQQRYLRRVNEHFRMPVVREVRVRVYGSAERRRHDAEAERSPKTEEGDSFDPDGVSLNADDLAWVEERASLIRDAAAREPFRRALLCYLKRRKWERGTGNKAGP